MPIPAEPASPEAAARLCARLARLLIENGADADYALRQLYRAAAALGHPVHAQLGDGAVLVTAGDAARFGTRVSRPLAAMAVDVARLAAIDAAIGSIGLGALAATRLDGALDAVEDGAGGHGTPAVTLGVALTAASLARLFGATWPVVAAAFAAGLAGTVLRRRLAATRVKAVVAAFAVALAGGLVAALATALFSGQSAVLALTAAGMVMVPGVPLINGVRDLVDGHAGLAVARLALASATVLAIGFALFLAARIAATALPVGDGPGRLGVAEDALFSAIAVVGYAMLFNLPWRALPIAMACGVASHAGRTALGWGGIDLVTGSLAGAALAGFIARVASRRLGVPAVSFAFPGTVAMIPGSYGFRAGIGGLHLMALGPAAPPALVADTLSLAITTAMMTAAIGVGLSLAFAVPTPQTRTPI